MEFSNDRYETMNYNRVGNSGLKLSAISLGMWHNFGQDNDLATQFELLKMVFRKAHEQRLMAPV